MIAIGAILLAIPAGFGVIVVHFHGALFWGFALPNELWPAPGVLSGAAFAWLFAHDADRPRGTPDSGRLARAASARTRLRVLL